MINPNGRVISVDINSAIHPSVLEFDVVKRRVQFIKGSSIDPAIVRSVADGVGNSKLMVILDSDHTAEHVLAELRAYAPMVAVGNYVIVQDVWVGPGVAVHKFLRENKHFEADRTRERFLITNCERGFLKRVR
jgi:cephalosporin hydroxylase